MLAKIVLAWAILSVILSLVAGFAPNFCGATVKQRITAMFKNLARRSKFAMFMATIFASTGSSIIGAVIHSWSIGLDVEQTTAVAFALAFIVGGAIIIVKGGQNA
jgi:prepilin signal peptidase PulO-like enzyme (type II secretory pathway)